MPACSGYSALQAGKSLLQAGQFGLERRGKLDALLQVGRFGLQPAELFRWQQVSNSGEQKSFLTALGAVWKLFLYKY
ncbi:hypothetical protein [Paenibacillus contaminans]|uniref:Uncharacterized protein n=1 Tax=Paenibacillus contaminans TaxID=450362 RepID=A0A329MLD9_9BACL|nr:hypothetical protein [Paenibacillus contaminans]RAV20432.1 hypothetical protein DQG23_15840 [Paenibacillus contaminans]